MTLPCPGQTEASKAGHEVQMPTREEGVVVRTDKQPSSHDPVPSRHLTPCPAKHAVSQTFSSEASEKGFCEELGRHLTEGTDSG